MTSGSAQPSSHFAPRLKARGFLGNLRAIQREPLSLYERAWRECGEVARIPLLPGQDFYVISHPEGVERVLVTNHKNYPKPGFFNRLFGLVTPEGLLVTEGEPWRTQRKLMTPSMAHAALLRLAPAMVEPAMDWLRALDGKLPATVEVVEAMTGVTLRVVAGALFGSRLGNEFDRFGPAVRETLAHVNYRMNHAPWMPGWLPTERNRRFRAARSTLYGLVRRLIHARRGSSEDSADLLSSLLHARDEEIGRGMSERLLEDEAVTLMVAGHDTMAAAISWTLFLLGQDRRAQEDIADEVRGCMRGEAPVAEDLPGLKLTRAAFEEALRLYPPAWGQPRQAAEADEIQGRAIPRGAIVAVSQWITHRRPDLWEQPELFRPERFLDGGKARHRYAYYPFGGGPRVCLGMAFALMEGPLILATLLRRLRFELAPGQSISPDPTFTLRPRPGVVMRIEERK